MMKTVRDIPKLLGKKVLVRAPLNEPVEDGKITSDFRLRRAILTIKFLTQANARVVVIGHIGRSPSETLEPVYNALEKKLPKVSFLKDIIGAEAHKAVDSLDNGEVLLLENLRSNPGEIENNQDFARALASLGDVFVQDAFDTCHRGHASIVGVPKFIPSYAGLLLEEEINALNIARTPKHPALAIIGGAKFATKEPVLHTLLSTYDKVFVGGALANDFLIGKGFQMQRSLVSNAEPSAIKELLAYDNLILPKDVVVAPEGADVNQSRVSKPDGLSFGDSAYDIGTDTIDMLDKLSNEMKTIIWNGPLGNYERGFKNDTSLARTIANSSSHSIIGGGDTVAEIDALGLSESFSFVSTGGGAMLDFLTEGTLPGISALG
ncbi:Phosphoglycerate kinase [hydrothermal vent metagenome]|uniref:phosphoglycerate kinase n=1 Tax=hydrothermal vent metagenome TaxID=652676 RepID=A0A3B0UQT9_9ZZZZ